MGAVPSRTLSRAGLVLVLLAVGAVLAPGVAGAATIGVSTTTDVVADDGQCSFREAGTAANDDAPSGASAGECPAGSGADVIRLGTGQYRPPGPLTSDVTIRGVSARASVVEGGREYPDPAGDNPEGSSIALFVQDARVRLARVTVRDVDGERGLDTVDGDPFPPGDGQDGWGIYSTGGGLTVEEVSIFNNHGGSAGENLDGFEEGKAGDGGGIHSDGAVTLIRSTVANSGRGAFFTAQNDPVHGAGIHAPGAEVAVTNSTIAANEDNGIDAGSLEMTQSTLADQVGATDGTLRHTLIDPDHNFGAGCGGVSDGGGNMRAPQGTSGCPGTVADPQLGPLQNNGGPTDTMALRPGSPAVDAVPATEPDCGSRDQRGVARPQGPGCDIGAFELGVGAAEPTAGLASVEAGQPVFRARGEIANAVNVTYSEGAYVIEDTAASIAPGPGCVALTPARVSCASNAAAARVNVGDGDDRVTVAQRGCECSGGPGEDTLSGGPGNDTLSGGPEDDTLSGGEAGDRLSGGDGHDSVNGGRGADLLIGGPGIDLTTYAERTNGVVVTLDSRADDGNSSDGPVGARDKVDTERVAGGRGADSLTGSGGSNELRGGEGNDTLAGAGGPDRLVGGAGTDTASYAGRLVGVSVTLNSGFPDDDGNASDGPPRARDRVETESVTGSQGDDTLDLRDGLTGRADCNSGSDTVFRDPADTAAADCETVSP